MKLCRQIELKNFAQRKPLLLPSEAFVILVRAMDASASNTLVQVSPPKAAAIIPLAIGRVVEETAGAHRFQIIQAEPTSLRVRRTVRQDGNADAVWEGDLDGQIGVA